MKIKLPADLAQYELIGDTDTLSIIMFDSIEGRIDIKMLTKEEAERLIKRKVSWLRKKPKVDSKNSGKKLVK